MGQFKKALMDMEMECNAHVHPLFASVLNNFVIRTQDHPTDAPEPETQPADEPGRTYTVYVLLYNGVPAAVYEHEETADYDRHVSQLYDEMQHPDDPGQYTVAPILMHTHRMDK